MNLKSEILSDSEQRMFGSLGYYMQRPKRGGGGIRAGAWNRFNQGHACKFTSCPNSKLVACREEFQITVLPLFFFFLFFGNDGS